MITVLQVNKQGNRIVSYTCTDGNKTGNISKEELIHLIVNGRVANAKIQTYKGQNIVRVTDVEKKFITKEQVQIKRQTILEYITAAKNRGETQINLTNILVDTNTLEILTAQNQNIKSSPAEPALTQESIGKSPLNSTNKLQNMLADKQLKINNNKSKELNTKYSDMINKVKYIQSNRARIELLINNATTLYKFLLENENNRAISQGLGISSSSLYTDGWDHKFGLIGKNSLGCEAGGACGKLDFITDGSYVAHFTDKDGNIISIEEFEKLTKQSSYSFIANGLAKFQQNLLDFEAKVSNYTKIIETRI